MIYISEEYSRKRDILKDNLDFVLWVVLFSVFIIVVGLLCGFLLNWILGGILIVFAFFYLLYLFVKIKLVRTKFMMTEYGIRGEKINLADRFNKQPAGNKADEFYLVYSDVLNYRFRKNNTLQIRNKNISSFDDLNYTFSNISDENIEKIKETFKKFGVPNID